MKTLKGNARGICIHLCKYPDNIGIEVEPLENIAEHQSAAEKNNGLVYFSCKQEVEDIDKIDYVILLCNGDQPSNHYFFAAKCIRADSRSKPFCPDDAANYCPKRWADVEAHTWFLLRDFKLFIDEGAFRNLIACDEGRESDFLTRTHSPLRLSRCNVYGNLDLWRK